MNELKTIFEKSIISFLLICGCFGWAVKECVPSSTSAGSSGSPDVVGAIPPGAPSEPLRANPFLALPAVGTAATRIRPPGYQGLQPRPDYEAFLRATAGTAALAAIVHEAAAVVPPEPPAVVEEDAMSLFEVLELPFEHMDISDRSALLHMDVLTTSIPNFEIVSCIMNLLNSGVF